MKRVGIAFSLCFALAACDQKPVEQAGPKRMTKAEYRAEYAVPLAERPVMGKLGDTSCTVAENDVQLRVSNRSCLSLQKDTIKEDPAAGAADTKLARAREVFFQPGPKEKDKTVGWILYATRTNCGTQDVVVMGRVVYDPGGLEITRGTPAGGPSQLPDGLTTETLAAAVCSG